MSARDVLELPVYVLRDRRIHGLAMGEALAMYLCEDPNGPQLSRREAAELMGLEEKRNVLTLIKRAREKLGAGGPVSSMDED